MKRSQGSVIVPDARELFAEWERSFRADASADKYAIFRDHLNHLKEVIMLANKPHLLLEGTIEFVRACMIYATMDNSNVDLGPFFKMQTYNPAQATKARYAVTFDVVGKLYARILVGSKMYPLDFADLFNHPWQDYRVGGFSGCWISHPDWSKLSNRENARLAKQVTDDLRFDYTEEELDLWFDGDTDRTLLVVCAQEEEV